MNCSRLHRYNMFTTCSNCLVQNAHQAASLVLDCANGVGAPSMRKLLTHLKENSLNITFANEGGELNHECGADFVKISQNLPANLSNVDCAQKCASFDGDADRLVYFRRVAKESDHVNLLDGDKIAVLLTKYIKEQLDAARLTDQLSIGIVQTAYANGASTKYIKEQLVLISSFSVNTLNSAC